MRRIIVAYGLEREIGRNNALPWAGELPAEMAFFKSTTQGSSVIMGRNTYDSIGRPLPHRYNIVVSRALKELPGCFVAHSLEEALERGDQETFDSYIIGGSQLYAEGISEVDEILASEIQHIFPGSDTFFPRLDRDEWATELVTSRNPDSKNKYGFNVIRYSRVDI